MRRAEVATANDPFALTACRAEVADAVAYVPDPPPAQPSGGGGGPWADRPNEDAYLIDGKLVYESEIPEPVFEAVALEADVEASVFEPAVVASPVDVDAVATSPESRVEVSVIDRKGRP